MPIRPIIIIIGVKRARVPAGPLTKMATDADVDSVRIRALIHSVGAFTWNVWSLKIHGGIRNIRYKTRFRGPFYCSTIAPIIRIFWRGCFVFMLCCCRGYLYILTRVPGIFTRVLALYEGWLTIVWSSAVMGFKQSEGNMEKDALLKHGITRKY